MLARVDQRLAALGLTANEASRRATGSTETIRNWRRRLKNGETEFGAALDNVVKIAVVLECTAEWLLGDGPDDWDQAIQAFADRTEIMRIYDSLAGDPKWQSYLLEEARRLGSTVRAGEALPEPPTKVRKQ